MPKANNQNTEHHLSDHAQSHIVHELQNGRGLVPFSDYEAIITGVVFIPINIHICVKTLIIHIISLWIS